MSGGKTLADIIRDSSLAKSMFQGRYGEQDPYVLALQSAPRLGYPVPGASTDIGEAQRYEASRLAAQKYGALPLLTNPLHEAVLSWFSEGEGRPSWDRLQAGYRGAFEGMSEPQQAAPPTIGSLIAQSVASRGER